MNMPCEECIALVMCRNKTQIECKSLTDYSQRLWKRYNGLRYKKLWQEINRVLPNMKVVKYGPRGFGKSRG